MNDNAPASIVTDRDKAIQAAVVQVFPDARHCINKWNVLRECQEMMAPGFESSFFDGYVNQQTTLPMFFRQYETALESSYEKEVEADFDRISTFPVFMGVGYDDNMMSRSASETLYCDGSCLKSMTWVMENKNSIPADRVAVINLKLQDYRRTPSGESEVKFHLSQLQDTGTISEELEVKFQVSRNTLGAMLRSMATYESNFQVKLFPPV
ncbi:hypothetical protein ACH5RR_009490 [Cinchona calisaya]|uniref:MULE transposase domain-containing protein n=1 Tax=Cinchona calisaya TaxID=153742 RepID=A0ABD3AGB3_9GENT